jgi:hypothetical protein
MTAVEFIEKAYNEAYLNMWTHNVPIHKDFIPNLFKQAKEIEKQQLEKTFKDSFVYGLDWNQKEISFDEYYNETFKNK